MARPWRGVIEEYRERLPVTTATPVITLGEGGTPLVRSAWLSETTRCDVFIKVEGDNPTGSFKDRGMTVAVSKAAEVGAKVVACASTGNTSASAAAYAVRAGMRPLVLVPEGRISRGKLAQAIVFGAQLIEIKGNFDDCLRVARELTDNYPVVLVNSANTDGYRLAGQKTAAYEIVDALGRAPDIHILPVGNAGNITAYWAGFGDLASEPARTDVARDPHGANDRRDADDPRDADAPRNAGNPHGADDPRDADAPRNAGHPRDTDSPRGADNPHGTPGLPRMWGFQAEGAAPIVHGAPVEHPDTVATAIRVGNPARWTDAVRARNESGGRIDAIADAEILAAQADLASKDGVFVEPASAVGAAGLLRTHAAGEVDPGQLITITVTGHGLKDVDTALTAAGAESRSTLPPDAAAIARTLGLE